MQLNKLGAYRAFIHNYYILYTYNNMLDIGYCVIPLESKEQFIKVLIKI